MIRPTLAAAALLGFGLPAAAQDSFSLSYGAAVTSNYIDKGTSQSDGKPAVQGYVEGAYGIFYGGVWTLDGGYLRTTTSRSTSTPGCGRARRRPHRRLQLLPLSL